MNYGRLVVFLFIGLSSCSHLSKQNTDPKQITLSSLRKIQPGVTTSTEVREVLGDPGEITQLSQPSSKEVGEVWVYFENGSTRASITIGKNNRVTFWGWHVYEQDSERHLENALSRFPEAHWKVESVKWINPHSWPNECYFTDQEKGITVEFHRARKEVAMIESWDPSRKPASSESKKPPIFCIDGTCSPALSFKEVFGSKALCELPK